MVWARDYVQDSLTQSAASNCELNGTCYNSIRACILLAQSFDKRWHNYYDVQIRFNVSGYCNDSHHTTMQFQQINILHRDQNTNSSNDASTIRI